jgi:SlyX protein
MLSGFPVLVTACYDNAMTDITHLEEKIAHLTRTVEDLSDIVAAQQKQLDTSSRKLAMLMEREAGREMDAGGSIPLADQRPPHW